MSIYEQHDRQLLAVDCIIFAFLDDKLKVLLIQRDFEPQKGAWSLMGGFVNKTESLDEAAARVLHELTGLDGVYLEQFHAFGSVNRDPVERTISVGYYALLVPNDQRLSERYSARWFDVQDLPKLIFDHPEMIRAATERLRHRAKHRPVGFELLPDKFTLSQVQKLYEAIFDARIDNGNFRRQIRKMDFLVQLNEKEKTSSRRGAHYYRFDHAQYAGEKFTLKP